MELFHPALDVGQPRSTDEKFGRLRLATIRRYNALADVPGAPIAR
jgi:hypothetical protein